MTIKRELNALTGVYSVEGDVDHKEIIVTFEPDSVFDKIKETLTEIGYPPA
jgi:copper chaperone CopZ